MNQPGTADKSTALELVLDVLPRARQIVLKTRRYDRHLADQLRRAMTSIALNLAEADGNRAGNRRLRLETALGSIYESRVALRVVAAWGYADSKDIGALGSALDRAGAMTWRRMKTSSRNRDGDRDRDRDRD